MISIGVGVCAYPLVNILTRKIGKKPLLIGACITYVLLCFGIYFLYDDKEIVSNITESNESKT